MIHPNTYVAGEDEGRLAETARNLGLDEARVPFGNVRKAVTAILTDSTLETARMHAVGALGQDEHIDSIGNVHMTLTRRRRGRPRKIVQENDLPKYGSLADLFSKELGSSTVQTQVQDPQQENEQEQDVEEETIDIVEGGTMTAAIFGIIKGTIGPAILYLPRGFVLAGWGIAIPAMLLSTTSFIYSAYRLLECWRVEKEKQSKLDEIRAFLLESPTPQQQPNGYGSVVVGGGENAESNSVSTHKHKLLTYPELARRAFGPASIVVQVGIALMQFGVCLTYLIFVPQNLHEAVRGLFGWEVEKTVLLIIMVLIQIPLAWIRDIRKLTPFNVLATFLIAYGLASCLAIAFWEITKDPSSTFLDRLMSLSPTNNDTWFLFIGTAFFAFEGSITLIVPLQEAVFLEEDKKRFPLMNERVTSSIVALYICFALICWSAFGNSVKTALTASLPAGAFSTSVQLAYSIAVIFTFPLQAFPALEIVKGGKTDPSEATKLNILASTYILGLGLVAFFAIDYLGNVVSLLGSLVGIPIALIYPPLMHNILVRDSLQRTRIKNYCVACIGVLAMGFTSYTTILSWDKGAEGE